MTIFTPGWMQGGSYVAQYDRINSRAADWDEGVMSRVDLKVTQRAAGANLSVDVAAGACVVTGDDQPNQGNYNVFSDAVVNVPGFTAPGSNSRYDLVGVQINDPNAGGAAGSNATIVRVAGTSSATPVIPTIPNSFLPLAIIGPILTTTTTITTSMIHDVWTGTGPTGVTGVRLCAGFRDTPGTSKESYNAVAPNGWLVEDGSAISRTTYARLFEHFGVVHGAGNGTTTFNLPDSRGRVGVAIDNQGANGDAGVLTSANAVGTKLGAEKVQLVVAELASHTHAIDHDHPSVTSSVNSVGHTHGVEYANSSFTTVTPGGGISVPVIGSGQTGTQSVNHTHNVDVPNYTGPSAGTGSDTAHNNMQPSIFLFRHVRT